MTHSYTINKIPEYLYKNIKNVKYKINIKKKNKPTALTST